MGLVNVVKSVPPRGPGRVKQKDEERSSIDYVDFFKKKVGANGCQKEIGVIRVIRG